MRRARLVAAGAIAMYGTALDAIDLLARII